MQQPESPMEQGVEDMAPKQTQNSGQLQEPVVSTREGTTLLSPSFRAGFRVSLLTGAKVPHIQILNPSTSATEQLQNPTQQAKISSQQPQDSTRQRSSPTQQAPSTTQQLQTPIQHLQNPDQQPWNPTQPGSTDINERSVVDLRNIVPLNCHLIALKKLITKVTKDKKLQYKQIKQWLGNQKVPHDALQNVTVQSLGISVFHLERRLTKCKTHSDKRKFLVQPYKLPTGKSLKIRASPARAIQQQLQEYR